MLRLLAESRVVLPLSTTMAFALFVLVAKKTLKEHSSDVAMAHIGSCCFSRIQAPVPALNYFLKLQILSQIPLVAGREEGPPKRCGAALELCCPADRAPRQ